MNSRPGSENPTQTETGEPTVPERFSFSLGGPFGPSYRVELFWKSRSLFYELRPWSRERQQESTEFTEIPYPDSERGNDVDESPSAQRTNVEAPIERWRAFRQALDEINVWRWKRYYSCPVCDAASWKIVIVWGSRRLNSRGLGEFPLDFETFCKAVERLLGGLQCGGTDEEP